MSEQYIDLLVSEGGIDFDAGQQPIYTNNRNSIAQDIKHAILESGLLREMQAERNRALRADVLTQIEMLVEDDERIVPGTAEVTEQTAEKIWIFAETEDYGPINYGVAI
ncbi:DUF2590 family protein [Vibrio sp. 1403]|uniref:DUF2590 family protein n=1 Tax=Vibrio TaxID=662 RepID=UPI000940C7B2|nr:MULTISPECIES: DUF2590 family protein [Vibrio]MBO0197746.1 DUF2590 family protein [Vibrio alginolyticus]MDW2054898.1 DUF2590 family protein [Vibrio sp. 506]MDW3078561.1 DUF2590 family protein [Vibrio sp. 1403]OKQ14253.1 hypothetical protein H058_08275 [Vibrio antiquarius]